MEDRSGISQHLISNGMELLDTTYPYEPDPYDPAPGSPGTFAADGVPNIRGDAPVAPLFPPTISQTSALDSFDLWLMYLPPGTGSVFVPIKKLQWFWAGDAQRTIPNPWILVSSDSGWGYAGDYPAFPAWSGYMNEYLGNTWLP
ncbi:MAG: hypothetical protein WAO58_07730 [Fimbriimonadaceae bacterium]